MTSDKKSGHLEFVEVGVNFLFVHMLKD